MPTVPRLAAAKGLSYRSMTDADLPFARDVYVSTRLEELAVTGWPLDVQRQFLNDQFELQHKHYRTHYTAAEWLIIQSGGEPIGRLYLEQRGDELRIIDIALKSESRGRGYGTAILKDLIAEYGTICSRLSIHVEKNNSARSLYLRLGFKPIEEHGVYDLMAWMGANQAIS